MRKLLLFTLLAGLLTTVPAQNPNYNVGPVWRVIYVHVNPGQGDVFWADVKQNLKPLWDAQKQQKLISDYKLYINPVANQPDDWNVAIAIQYPNWAALDELAAKGESLATQRYGSREAMLAAAKKRSEYGKVISNQLAREVMLK